MSHIESIKKLFGRFKSMSKQHDVHSARLEELDTVINQLPETDTIFHGANDSLIFLKGKSAVFAREFEKLRLELNSFKNSVDTDLNGVATFNQKLDFLEEKLAGFGVLIEKLASSLGSKRPAAGGLGSNKKTSIEKAPSQRSNTNIENEEPMQEKPNESSRKGNPSGHSKKANELDSTEVFIGQKLFSYVGIGILVIGLGLGAKLAIENDWLGPIFQLLVGYGAAIALCLLGIRLKKKYEAFSAVLIGGGLATAYFMTYASYAFYGYFGQVESFVLMIIITAATVFAALKYNQELIAILGMVGAYGIPFLLDNNSGRVHIMFTYMAIINAGILFIGFKKFWRALYYSAFGLTWLIFSWWFMLEYGPSSHFQTAVIFLSIFFMTFYSAFLAHKLIQKEDFNGGDISLVLINSIFFFLMGYAILDSTVIGQNYLGLFALFNAAFHFLITLVFYKNNLAGKGLFYIEAGMVLLFISIAIPIQFDGNWIPIFWTLEALILFFIGRVQGIKVYELLSYPMIVLAFFSVFKSLILDYRPYFNKGSDDLLQLNFIANEVFLGAALACLGFAVLSLLNRWSIKRPLNLNNWQRAFDYILPIMTFALVYFSFFAEIFAYWTSEFILSKTAQSSENWIGSWFGDNDFSYNYDLLRFRAISIIDYTLIFIGCLGLLNWKIWKNKDFGTILTAISMLGIFVYTMGESVAFSRLAESLNGENSWNAYYGLDANKVYLYKYASLLLFVAFAGVQFLSTKALQLGQRLLEWNAGLIHLCALIIISHEFLFIAETNGFSNSTKTALSVMWAAYAVVLMAVGISKGRGYLRIAAFGIWCIVLAKLLLYDLIHLSLEVKTLVFITIGVLLLIVSYLYYRFFAKQKQEESSESENREQETGH